MVAAILKEMDLQKNYLSDTSIETIYFGGGTPSLLNQDDLNLFFEKINQLYSVASDAEITLEANPCLLYTSPSPRDATLSRMPSSA